METVSKSSGTINLIISFYPTYKEWKPGFIQASLTLPLTFYPTYKEWRGVREWKR